MNSVAQPKTKETVPLLQSPTNEYLSVIFSVFVRNGRDDGVIKHPLLSPD